MKIGNRSFDTKNDCYIMGILNVTPDSFSDGGQWNQIDKAREHTGRMIQEGASIIDIGGESTRPGHVQITVQEEIDRVVPMIRMVKENYDIPVSIDSYKGAVVEAALDAGADMVNDIWGLKYDYRVAELIAQRNVPCCLMHNREKPEYQDFLREVHSDLEETLAIARKAGIRDEQIILDPGVGFGKTYENNLEIIKNLDVLTSFGLPVLLATSRKSVIGLSLDLPADQRVEGTVVTTVMGVEQGCSFVRVHDVKENMRAIRMTQAILNGGKPGGN